MSVGLEDFRDAFVGEADELLATANAQALALETAAREGSGQARSVRELFRAVHTIKGLASMVNVEPIVSLAHAMEELLRPADRTGALLAGEAIEAIVGALDAIDQRVKAVGKGEPVAEPPVDVLSALAMGQGTKPIVPSMANAETILTLEEEIAARLTPADRQQLVAAVVEGRRAVRLDFSPSPVLAEQGHTITTLRGRLGKVGELVKVVPLTAPSAPSGLSFALLLVTDATDEAITACAEAPIIGPSSIASVRQAGGETNTEVHQDAVRVDVARLDEALDRLSDMVITRFRLARAAEQLHERGADVRVLTEVVNENARQLRALRTAVLRVRMVALEEVFSRLRLLVRGITRGTVKRVRLDIDAAGSELDKGVAEQVFPALMHLARNAVDHGLEPPHERERAGKPPVGLLRVTCRPVSSTQVQITLEDDGRGIDADAVCARAGVPPVTSDAALLDVICSAGFSTRDEASTTSGRGMGMDIVRRVIVDQLGGDLTLETQRGQGTRFVLKVPLTIAIVDAFVFYCGGQRFVVPNTSIEEAIDVGNVSRPAGEGIGVLVHRGMAIPFVELSSMLRLTQPYPSPQAFVVRRHGDLIALGVEKIVTQQEVVVRPIEDKLVKAPGISGATDLGEGTPTLVLDLLRLGGRPGTGHEQLLAQKEAV